MSVNLDKPIELNDGTPLVLTDIGGTRKFFDIRLEKQSRKGHPAFPIYRNRGTARVDTGLVISNHKYFVRNRADTGVDRINLEFMPGDKVRHSYSWNSRGTTTTVKRVDSDGKVHLADGTCHPKTGLRFACHNHGAPFAKIEHDHAKTYQDGWFSGLFFGLHGQFYSAGGPGGIPMVPKHGSACRHHHEHDAIDASRNANWKTGWAQGQQEARHREKKCVSPSDPLRIRRFGGETEEVTKVSACPSGFVVEIDGRSLTFKPNGVCIDKGSRYILENTMSAVLERRAFGIFGQGHIHLFDTLEEVSEKWWETRKGAPQHGQFIVAVRQERSSGHAKWNTVDVSGPMEPLVTEWNHDTDGKRAKREGWQIDGHSGIRALGTMKRAKVVKLVVEGAREEGTTGQFYRRAIRQIKDNLPEGYLRMLEAYAEGENA